MPRLSVVLPAFNEGERIHDNVLRVLSALSGQDLEVVVVDDGSTDATLAESRRAAEGRPVRVVAQPANRGKGAALLAGFAAATGDRVAFLDADLEIAPQELLALLTALERTGADVAIGTKHESPTDFPWPRRVTSRVYRALVRTLFDLPLGDTQTGIKLFERHVLAEVAPRLDVRRFAFDLELLVAALRFGYRVVEVPITAAFLRKGTGRIGARQVLGMIADTFGVFYRASFWCWLAPGLATKLWMIAFVLGVLLFGVGVGKLITPLVLSGPVKKVFYVAALQFLPTTLRDALVAGGGAVLTGIALLRLNRILVDAFARRDTGDLAGILKRR